MLFMLEITKNCISVIEKYHNDFTSGCPNLSKFPKLCELINLI